jgi:hypothetical protein
MPETQHDHFLRILFCEYGTFMVVDKLFESILILTGYFSDVHILALWECGAPEQPESREWFKIHIRKNTRPSEDMYVGEISCKDEDGLKQFVNDHEGTIFAEEDSQEMVMLCFRHSDMRISPEEWEKMDCPVSMREIYGQMQE